MVRCARILLFVALCVVLSLTVIQPGESQLGPTPSGVDAPITAHYVTTQSETGLSAEFNLGSLSTGILKCTTAASVCTPSTVAAPTGTVVGTTDTQTLTNKRVSARTGTTTSSATPTINTDNVTYYSITAQTVDITSFTTNLSGTPVEGDTLWIAITGTGARAITWGAKFAASTVALPTTTVTTARLDVSFIWDSVAAVWRCIAVS